MEDGADGRGNVTYTHVSQPHVEHEAIISHSLLSLSVCTCPWYEQMMLPSQRQAAFFCVFPVTHQRWPFRQPPPNPRLPSGALAFHYSLEYFTQQPHCSGKAPITNCLCSLTPGLFSRSSNASSLRPFLTIPPNPSLLWTSPAISAFLAILGD